MKRVNLTIYLDPCAVEAFVRFKTKSGDFRTRTGIIDTGAEQSLFPLEFLNLYEHSIINPNLEIDQAGISKQSFRAIEAKIWLYFEDRFGNTSPEMEVRAWFADTEEVIIGFQDILDRAILHIDYRQSKTAWIEF